MRQPLVLNSPSQSRCSACHESPPVLSRCNTFSHFISVVLSQKKIPTPKWKPGYTAFYLVRLKNQRNIETKSALSLPNAPSQSNTDVRAVLQLQIVDAKNSAAGNVRLHTH